MIQDTFTFKMIKTLLVVFAILAGMLLVNGCFSQQGSALARDLGSLFLGMAAVCWLVLHVMVNIYN